VGLIGFAVIVWIAAQSWPALAVLAVATVVWLVVDGVLWALFYGRE
jgi:hypothetical protein